jgi:SAM-dependent methyltransferase
MDLHDRLRAWWDEDADTYDESAGHAMSDPVEAAAWAAALERYLPPVPARVLDVGAGTGALSLTAAALGHTVTALDLSEGMLERARAKATAAGLAIEVVNGPAEGPPAGPFDAVMERHLAWTLPDPVAAMAAWREVVVPGGRLVLFEGSWAGEGPGVRVTDALAGAIRRIRGMARDDHHAPYPPEIMASLPLAHPTSPAPFLRAVADAGWTGLRLERLPDVEWTQRMREPWPLGALDSRPRYAVIADAPR